MESDRNIVPETVLKVLSLQHSGNGDRRSKLQYIIQLQKLQPFPIVAHLRLLPVKDMKNLLLIGQRIDQNFPVRHCLSSFALSGRIANSSREISDDNDNSMPKILNLFQFPECNCVPEMKVGRTRVHAEFHGQRFSGLEAAHELCLQFLLSDQFRRALLDYAHLMMYLLL